MQLCHGKSEFVKSFRFHSWSFIQLALLAVIWIVLVFECCRLIQALFVTFFRLWYSSLMYVVGLFVKHGLKRSMSISCLWSRQHYHHRLLIKLRLPLRHSQYGGGVCINANESRLSTSRQQFPPILTLTLTLLEVVDAFHFILVTSTSICMYREAIFCWLAFLITFISNIVVVIEVSRAQCKVLPSSQPREDQNSRNQPNVRFPANVHHGLKNVHIFW